MPMRLFFSRSIDLNTIDASKANVFAARRRRQAAMRDTRLLSGTLSDALAQRRTDMLKGRLSTVRLVFVVRRTNTLIRHVSTR
jgi:hypothetical protein